MNVLDSWKKRPWLRHCTFKFYYTRGDW